jgi:predicted phage baseplate assembly protein
VGKRAEGTLVGATIVELGEGAARVDPEQGAGDFAPELVIPVDVLGNVAEAIRGETVIDEALGSADATAPFNRFTLRKKPLVWHEDASQPTGRRPDLTVRVGGLIWIRADTFFGRGPTEEIYVVRQEADGSATVTFGDGARGARPPTGVNNIRADYRFGAGAAKPPPGTIDQIVQRVKGLAAVRGPLPATGGADMETADDLRTAAPARALTLGRAVSLADFEALARDYSGVVNVQAGWIWDQRRQRAAAKLWVIAEGGLDAAGLAGWLAGQSVPDLIVVVEAATPAPFTGLSISLEIAARHDPVDVRAGVAAALFNPTSGLLSPPRQTIGGTLFRSALTLAIHRVAGVASVRAILIDGLPLPAGVAPGMGRWFDLQAGSTVV